MTPLFAAKLARRRVMARRAAVLLSLAAVAPLAGCGLYHPVSADDREATSTCNAEADRVYAARNRYQLSERDGSSSPYSGNTLPNNPSAGLSDRYEQEQYVDTCLARSGAGAPAAPTAAPAGK